MKIIAFYLPQFHQIPENDKWWGEGFTEWTNVRKAKPLFEGHYQPREPLGDKYYNLLDKNVLKWQANLARKYGVYGFCYYHYWFNGKLLLEKPIENMLMTGEPEFPFCLSWANEPWTRRWSGLGKDVLMPQNYGYKKDWERHFQYLLRYFLDKRYILIDDKPVFIIYRTSSIVNCQELLEYWEYRAKESGLKGIYFIETINSFQNKPYCIHSHGVLKFEPMLTREFGLPLFFRIKRKIRSKLSLFLKNFSLKIIDYDYIWKYILKNDNIFKNKKIFLCSFPSWDNTARRGYNGTVIAGASPEKFERYFKIQVKKAKNKYNSEYIFINAWNEWAEGAYLEPDKKYGYGYLKAIKSILDSLK
jgi:lipopolysaccharide biosynthesis protein